MTSSRDGGMKTIVERPSYKERGSIKKRPPVQARPPAGSINDGLEESNYSQNKDEVSEELHQSIVHPNMDGEGSDEDVRGTGKIKGFSKSQKKNCLFYCKKLDYEILRPLFIHDYERNKMQKEDELV